MNNVFDFSLEQLSERLKPAFRAKQVYNWLYKNYARSYDEMQNLPKALRQDLKHNYPMDVLKILKKEKSGDGSIKYLFGLKDGHTIESVLLKMKGKRKDKDGNIVKSAQYSFCVSTQVGCKMGCKFCLTGKGGFVRNLSAGEIVEQVRQLKMDNNIPASKAVNIVYMGMGEPLDNYDNLVRAIKIIAEPGGLAINTRRQTVSTSGISTKIERLGKENLGVQLAISLHAVDDELRTELIPLNRAYNIRSIIDAVKKFPVDTRKKVMFEYLVIKDKNDSIEAAEKLVQILHGINAKVNLIYFNPYPGTTYQRPTKDRMLAFQKYLTGRGIFCSIRESKGLDISAACGQLRENTPESMPDIKLDIGK